MSQVDLASLDLRHLPDTLELPKARWKLILMLVVSVVFFIAGFAMAADHDMRGLFVAGFFGLCFGVFIFALFGRTAVTLDRDGFTHQTLFGSKHYAWRDVSDVTHMRVGRTRMILFNDQTKVDTPFARFSRTMLRGYNAGIPTATLGGKLDTVCATMNAFRARALRRGA